MVLPVQRNFKNFWLVLYVMAKKGAEASIRIF